MTQEEILEYNKMCAEFLGLILHTGFGSKPNQYYKKNKKTDTTTVFCDVFFHSDWNWIHEIFEKINTSIITAPMKGIPDSIVPYLEAKNPIIISLLKNNKEEVVQAIYQFLKWYNDNTNK